MGLDIYISRRFFIWAMYRSRVITGKIELFSNGKLIPIKQKLVSSVTEELYHGSKTWWLWKWLEKETPELLESNGAEYTISVDMLQKLCRVCEEISAAKGSDAFFEICRNKLHYLVKKDIDPSVLQSFIQEIEQLVETLKNIEYQSDVDFCIAVSW